jgi:DNA-3-methyladenine glycosylase II
LIIGQRQNDLPVFQDIDLDVTSDSPLILKTYPPFHLGLTVRVLRRLPVNAIDRWDGATYTRVLPYGNTAFQVHVRQRRVGQPTLEVVVNGAPASAARNLYVTSMLEKLLGLKVELSSFYRKALRDKEFGPTARRFAGFRPPRFPSVFEAAINGISCQQLSLRVGISLLNKLSEQHGVATGGHHAFPRPEDLANAGSGKLKRLGYSSQKEQYILTISRAVSEGRLDLDGLAALNDHEAMEALLKIHGIGRWTAEYILLRGLGRLNVIPAGDIGIRNNLQRRLGLDHRPDADEVRSMLSRWHPYTGLMYFYFLLDYLQERSAIK